MTKRLLPLCLGVFLAFPLVAEKTQTKLFPLAVKRVVDGDTLLLSNQIRVRLVGIDTPEVYPSQKLWSDARKSGRDAKTIQSLGKRSSKFVEALIEGEKVRLEYEPANTINQHLDRHGRTLAYVFFNPPACEELEPWLAEEICELESFETGFLNALIIEAGYANTYNKFPFKYQKEFQELERNARTNKRGLWKPTKPST
ncbi:MAG: Thermonuclease [Elusimicrobia bacterium]|nr:Thermonuclease [Elusimicrobiota bacterium]